MNGGGSGEEPGNGPGGHPGEPPGDGAGRMHLTIGRSTLRLPVYHDETTSRAVAGEVTRYLDALEAEAERIDTHAFLLETAYHFACARHAARSRHEAEQEAVAEALAAVGEALQRILEDSEPG